MNQQTIKFKSKNEHRVCIHLKSLHFAYLRHLAITKFQGDLSKTILYLLSKYLKSLYRIKRIDQKRTLTIDYQPKTKEYKRFWISIQPSYWWQLHNLRFSLGYSMSFLLRIMIDWEMEENHEAPLEIIIPKPTLHESPNYQPPYPRLIHNYAQKVGLYHISRWVYLFLKGYD